MAKWVRATLSLDGTSIGELSEDVSFGESRETYDTTNTDIADGYRTFIGGWIDGGEITTGGNLTAAGRTALAAALAEADPVEAVVSLPGFGTWTADVIVTDYNVTAPVAEKASFSVTLKVTGKPTWTAEGA